MAELNQEDAGDRLESLDLLREMIFGKQQVDLQEALKELETQMDLMNQEMRTQGDETQKALDQKIDEVINAIPVSQFPSSPSPVAAPLPPPPVMRQPPEPQLIPPQTQPTTEPLASTPKEPDQGSFFDQINSILQNEPPPPEPNANQKTEPDLSEDFLPPNPVLEPPNIQPFTTPNPLPTPAISPQWRSPDHPITAPQKELTIIAEDEATQIHQLQRILLDEDIVRLREINNQLDFKLRQVEEYLAVSQEPLKNLLPLMTELLQLKLQESKLPKASELPTTNGQFPWRILLVFLFLLSLIPLAWYGYRLRREYVLEKDVAIAFTSTPELSLYRLDAEIKGDKIYLSGKVPSAALRDRATEVATDITPTLELTNNILVVDALSFQQAEINRILAPLNTINGIHVASKLAGDRLTLSGTVLKPEDLAIVIKALEQIGGIKQITNNIQVQAQPISARLYFDQDSATIKTDDIEQKLPTIKQFLKQYPNLNLRIIGYQHPTESATDVSLKRAQATQLILEDQGIDRRRLIALGIDHSPPEITPEEPIWLSRTVLFEIISPATTTHKN